MPQPDNVFPRSTGTETNISGGRLGGLADDDNGAGIVKTVTTVIKSDSDEECSEGYELSTKDLTRDFSYQSSNADVSPSP